MGHSAHGQRGSSFGRADLAIVLASISVPNSSRNTGLSGAVYPLGHPLQLVCGRFLLHVPDRGATVLHRENTVGRTLAGSGKRAGGATHGRNRQDTALVVASGNRPAGLASATAMGRVT